jgi:phosphopantetheine adenylyltransferase
VIDAGVGHAVLIAAAVIIGVAVVVGIILGLLIRRH